MWLPPQGGMSLQICSCLRNRLSLQTCMQNLARSAYAVAIDTNQLVFGSYLGPRVNFVFLLVIVVL